MATSSVATIGTEFELELAKVRNEIQSHFSELVKSVRTREAELLKEVDTILTKFKEKVKEKDKMKIELDKTKQLIQQNIQLPGLMSLQQDFMKKIEESLNKIKGEIENWEISFTFDKNLNQSVKRQGQVSIKSPFHKQNIPPIDYATKLQPVKSFGTAGKAPGQFNGPWSIAVDPNTKNIYISDHSNNRVQVFSQECRYLSKFGDDGRMNNPIGITVYQEKVFVVQFNGSCLLVYKRNGTYIQTVGEGQLTNPYGIDINMVNGDIYVCDTGNNRIQVFTREFNLKTSLFGDDLDQPYDINLTEDSIFVLDASDPCILIYDYNHVLIRNIVKRSSQFAFCVDSVNNICMTDYDSGRVMVFDIEGTLIHQFGRFTHPNGIAITNNSNVIICSDTPGNCIQIWCASTVGEGQLAMPYGIDIHKVNGDIYVCETGNNRIQVFTQGFNLKTPLWDNVLKEPYDINLTEDSIFVLDSNDPCIHIYNYNHVLIRNIIKRSSQYVFYLDKVSNIYMGDHNSGHIMVFDIEGTLIHQFGRFTRPRGIAITNNSNVIICSDTPGGNCIQIWK